MGSLNIYNKKKTKGKTITIIILIIVIIALLCISYLEVEEVNKQNQEYKNQIQKLKKQNQEKKETSKPSALVKFLEQNKVRTFITSIGQDQIDFTTQITNANIINAVLNIKNNPASINISEINNYLKLYGIEKSEYPNIYCPIDNTIIYQYNSTNQTYNQIPHEHITINTNEPIYIKPLKLEEKNGTYILTTNEIYINENISTFTTADPNGKVEIKPIQTYKKENGEIDTIKIIEDYEKGETQNLPKYKYTFKKDEKGSYYLTNYSKES